MRKAGRGRRGAAAHSLSCERKEEARRQVVRAGRLLRLIWASLLISVTLNQVIGAGRDPAMQVEPDWVDSRWNRTEVGQFLASNLDVSGNRIAKALSIKVGENDEGAVCFDTALCALRAGWTGGFLQFDPARFGLIQGPRIAGEVKFSSPTGLGWQSVSNRYTGLHLHDKRVVLEYTVDDTRIFDSPWLENHDHGKVFTRLLELSPHHKDLRLELAAMGEDSTLSSGQGWAMAVARTGTNVFAVAMRGIDVTLAKEKGKLMAEFPQHPIAQRAKLFLWAGAESLLENFHKSILGAGEPEDLAGLLQPGNARWLPELKTVGQRGLDTDFLAVDTLTVPYDNPWRALMFLAGVDFTPDGAAYICSIHGDVWKVTGINENLRDLRWKRFATGLFQALGLKVRAGQILVLGRDQITRLHDQNGDGEADFYENFSNLIATAPGHSYVTSLEKDDAGNLYYVDPRGLYRVSPDGLRQETLATGFRNANGLGVSPDGKIISVAPQQGEWTPSSAICEIKLNGYYGYGGPKVTPERPLGYDLPLCWIPHHVDNSGGSQVWVPPGQWGRLAGQMLHLLWGRCSLSLVLRQVTDGIPQAAIVPLPARFLSGPMRGSFHPRDGHLYIACSTGWQTSAVKDGALHRVRFTGKRVDISVGWHAQSNGLTLAFAQPLDRSAAEDLGSYALHQWNYKYAPQYGSKEWSVTQPENEGREELTLKSALVTPDGKSVFLEIPGLRPVMQMEIKYSLNAADGEPCRGQLWLTLNRLPGRAP